MERSVYSRYRVDQHLMAKRLSDWPVILDILDKIFKKIGIRGKYHAVFLPIYQKRSTLSIIIGSHVHISKKEKTVLGVPQGSVLGPLSRVFIFLPMTLTYYMPTKTEVSWNSLEPARVIKSLRMAQRPAIKLSLNIKKIIISLSFTPIKNVLIMVHVSLLVGYNI